MEKTGGDGSVQKADDFVLLSKLFFRLVLSLSDPMIEQYKQILKGNILEIIYEDDRFSTELPTLQEECNKDNNNNKNNNNNLSKYKLFA